MLKFLQYVCLFLCSKSIALQHVLFILDTALQHVLSMPQHSTETCLVYASTQHCNMSYVCLYTAVQHVLCMPCLDTALQHVLCICLGTALQHVLCMPRHSTAKCLMYAMPVRSTATCLVYAYIQSFNRKPTIRVASIFGSSNIFCKFENLQHDSRPRLEKCMSQASSEVFCCFCPMSQPPRVL